MKKVTHLSPEELSQLQESIVKLDSSVKEAVEAMIKFNLNTAIVTSELKKVAAIMEAQQIDE